MTINIADNSPRISYSVADGVTQTSFAVPFEFFDDEDLNVYVDGTLKTLTSDYTVAGGDGSTGTVTISVTGGSGGSTVVITRDIDLERTTDFPVSGAFNIVALNTELDRLVAIAADLEDLAGRGVKLADFDTQAALTLPLASERGNKVLAFNATGDTLISQELGTWQSDWAASTEYKERDLVRDSSDGSIYIVNSAHTSSGTTPLDTNTNSSKYDVIFDVGAMIAGTVTMTGDLTVQGNTTLGNASSDSITMTGTAANLRMSTTNVTDILDEDTMSSDSATALATQQSIKAYVDSQVGASDTLTEILGNGNTTSGTNLVVSSGDTLDIDGALDASGTISLGGNFPTGTDNVALGSSALGAVLSTGERNTIIGSFAGDGITNGDNNTALGAGALGSITTQSSNTAVGRNALTSTTGTANTALGNGAGSTITSGQYNTVIGLFNGNQNSLDIRTSSNNVVLSDGQGNVRFYANSSGNVGFGSVSPDAELHISSSSSTPKIIIENSINPRGNFIGVENNGDLVLGADEDSLSGSSSIKFKVDGTQVMSLDYQGTLALTGNATFGDNDKAIFGAGSDLQIYHDGSKSLIEETGTGSLTVRGTHITFQNGVATSTYANFVEGAEVSLRYNNAIKLATTSTGVDITGTLTSDGLTVDGRAVINGSGFSTSLYALTIDTTFDRNGLEVLAGNSGIGKNIITAKNHDGTKEFFNVADSGDISFYEDTGTTAKFFWDASAERLAVGGTTTNATLHVHGNSVVSNGNFFSIQSSSGLSPELDEASNGWAFTTNGSERMRIDSSGNVGIGTSSPDALLNLSSDSASDGAVLRLENSRTSMFGGDKYGQLQFFGNDSSTTASGIRAYINTLSTGGNGEAHMAFGTAAPNSAVAEAMRIDSSGNVGIGTSSPSAKLHVKGTSTAVTSTIETTSLYAVNKFKTGTREFDIALDGNGLYVYDQNNSTERMRIDLSGNVGIGTSSPQRPLHVDGAEGVARFTSTASGNNGFEVGIGASSQAFLWQSENSYMQFATNATERMRIDSSGNLLVGKTTTANTAAGSVIYAGKADLTRSDNGSFLDMHVNGTTVGSIGTSSFDLTVGNDDVGFKFHNASNMIIPWNLTTNGGADNTTNLGDSSNRFKDLYLSGGVYLGGTGSANKLDDYEEGTWTPTFASTGTDPTVTYGTRSASYRKVGSLVTVWIDMTVSSYTGGTGNGVVESFPFSQSGSARGVISGRSVNGITHDKSFQIELIGGTGYFSEDATGDIPLSDFSTGGFRIIMSGSYTTA